MPRYEIRRTSDNALTYVEGDNPLNLMLSQAAGTYRAKVMSAEEPTDIVVPTLTAGTISNVSPVIGATLSVTGSNAPTGSTFAWQYSADNISFAAAGGTNNGATYNTTGQPVGWYRRGSTAGPQGPVFTPSVQVISAQVDATVVDTHFTNSNNLTSITRTGRPGGAEAPDREYLLVLSAHFGIQDPTPTSWEATVNGVPCGAPIATYIPIRFCCHFVWRVSVPTGTTFDWSIVRVSGTSTIAASSMQLVRLTGNPTAQAMVTALTSTQNGVLDVSQNVAQGSAIIAGAASRANGTTTSTLTWAGVTQQGTNGTLGAQLLHAASVAFAGNVSAASPRTITVTESGANAAGEKSAFSMELVA